MFTDFDFDLLLDRDFKEDSVREELILPIIKSLGYSASGDNRIVRSKALLHPFVSIGSKKNKINIIPDYTFLSGQQPYWILDAKSPSEDISKSCHVEQAYSYAIHPEIRAKLYALCNGKQFALYDISKAKPILLFDLKDINKHWNTLNRILNPDIKATPDLIDYDLDFGLVMLKLSGYNYDLEYIATSINSKFIAKVNDNLYTVSTTVGGDRKCLMSIDLSPDQYQDLLSLLEPSLKEDISTKLKHMPYFAETSQDFQFGFKGHLSGEIMSNNEEEFLPFIVDELFPYIE